jgi:hypothetical protein
MTQPRPRAVVTVEMTGNENVRRANRVVVMFTRRAREQCSTLDRARFDSGEFASQELQGAFEA